MNPAESDREPNGRFKQKLSNEQIDKIRYWLAKGDCTDRMYWTLIYDFEHAPMTTNLTQLKEIGIEPTTSESLSDDEVVQALEVIITGLATLSIYLLNTNHLTDRGLYERLVTGILVEPVRDLPPNAGVEEFIDLQGGTALPDQLPDVCSRDSHLPRPKPRPTAVSNQAGGPHES